MSKTPRPKPLKFTRTEVQRIKNSSERVSAELMMILQEKHKEVQKKGHGGGWTSDRYRVGKIRITKSTSNPKEAALTISQVRQRILDDEPVFIIPSVEEYKTNPDSATAEAHDLTTAVEAFDREQLERRLFPELADIDFRTKAEGFGTFRSAMHGATGTGLPSTAAPFFQFGEKEDKAVRAQVLGIEPSFLVQLDAKKEQKIKDKLITDLETHFLAVSSLKPGFDAEKIRAALRDQGKNLRDVLRSLLRSEGVYTDMTSGMMDEFGRIISMYHRIREINGPYMRAILPHLTKRNVGVALPKLLDTLMPSPDAIIDGGPVAVIKDEEVLAVDPRWWETVWRLMKGEDRDYHAYESLKDAKRSTNRFITTNKSANKATGVLAKATLRALGSSGNHPDYGLEITGTTKDELGRDIGEAHQDKMQPTRRNFPLLFSVDRNDIPDALQTMKRANLAHPIGKKFWLIPLHNSSFSRQPKGWSRKWMIPTIQIFDEYWDVISEVSPIDLLYMIASRAKNLFDYDLSNTDILLLLSMIQGPEDHPGDPPDEDEPADDGDDGDGGGGLFDMGDDGEDGDPPDEDEPADDGEDGEGLFGLGEEIEEEAPGPPDLHPPAFREHGLHKIVSPDRGRVIYRRNPPPSILPLDDSGDPVKLKVAYDPTEFDTIYQSLQEMTSAVDERKKKEEELRKLEKKKAATKPKGKSKGGGKEFKEIYDWVEKNGAIKLSYSKKAKSPNSLMAALWAYKDGGGFGTFPKECIFWKSKDTPELSDSEKKAAVAAAKKQVQEWHNELKSKKKGPKRGSIKNEPEVLTIQLLRKVAEGGEARGVPQRALAQEAIDTYHSMPETATSGRDRENFSGVILDAITHERGGLGSPARIDGPFPTKSEAKVVWDSRLNKAAIAALVKKDGKHYLKSLHLPMAFGSGSRDSIAAHRRLDIEKWAEHGGYTRVLWSYGNAPWSGESKENDGGKSSAKADPTWQANATLFSAEGETSPRPWDMHWPWPLHSEFKTGTTSCTCLYCTKKNAKPPSIPCPGCGVEHPGQTGYCAPCMKKNPPFNIAAQQKGLNSSLLAEMEKWCQTYLDPAMKEAMAKGAPGREHDLSAAEAIRAVGAGKSSLIEFNRLGQRYADMMDRQDEWAKTSTYVSPYRVWHPEQARLGVLDTASVVGTAWAHALNQPRRAGTPGYGHPKNQRPKPVFSVVANQSQDHISSPLKVKELKEMNQIDIHLHYEELKEQADWYITFTQPTYRPRIGKKGKGQTKAPLPKKARNPPAPHKCSYKQTSRHKSCGDKTGKRSVKPMRGNKKVWKCADCGAKYEMRT